MKKAISLVLALMMTSGVLAFAGCDGDDTNASQGEDRGVQENMPSPLAVLDEIDVSKAFGDTAAADWSYALKIGGSGDAAYRFALTTGANDDEALSVLFGAGAKIEDSLGIRASDQNPLGFDLFGGGEGQIDLRYTGPRSDSEPVVKSFQAGFRHDGDLIWYADDGGESSVTLSDLTGQAESMIGAGMFARISEAAETIPEEVKKGGTLRFAVEKLIDLGFTAEIDDTDGLTVHLAATEGFYSDLLNDMAEEFLPAEWLAYIPRADIRYESTDFDILLAFDENGLFKSYTVTSDLSLELSIEVRGVFRCESESMLSGGFSVVFDASGGETPDSPAV